jgi:homoserine dehydrogenase
MDSSSQKPYRVALFGFGNIGTGVVRHFVEHGALLNERAGRPVELAAIVDREFDRPRAVAPPATARLSTNWREIAADPTIDAVIEVVGVGADGKPTLAADMARAVLGSGKDFITANKALIASHGAELQAIADANGALLLVEACVGAGIPLIASMQGGLAAARVTAINGILNGTCNYILTNMAADPTLTMEAAIADAQRLGYAEPDPSADVEGIDTAYKVAILAMLGFGGMVVPTRDVAVEGILRIGPADFEWARRHGKTIRLLGRGTRLADGSCLLRVEPVMVPLTHPLAGVQGVMNAVLITADPIGDTMYYGAGAGQPSTATGLMGDALRSAAHRAGHTPRQPLRFVADPLVPADAAQAPVRERAYFRVPAAGAEVLAAAGATVESLGAEEVQAVTPPLAPGAVAALRENLLSSRISADRITRLSLVFE